MLFISSTTVKIDMLVKRIYLLKLLTGQGKYSLGEAKPMKSVQTPLTIQTETTNNSGALIG